MSGGDPLRAARRKSEMSLQNGNSDFIILPTSQIKVSSIQEPLEQELERDILWYRDNFLGKPHWNFLSLESPRGPLSLSIVLSDSMLKAILRSGQGNQRFTLLESQITKSWWRKLCKIGPSFTQILYSLNPEFVNYNFKLVRNVNLRTDLISMEEIQVIKSYKFGILYLSQGQTTEIQSLSNTHEKSSIEYKNFLRFLGEEIELKDWKGYRGGLDTSDSTIVIFINLENLTGNTSIYTKWQGYEIMFHVSTLLPLTMQDSQRIDRKRHIGNDIVVIIFQESEEPFQLSSIISRQNHVIIIVQPVQSSFRITVATKNGVPDFTPGIPESPLLCNDLVSREYFLHLLINGERASYKSPSFAPKLERTRSVLLADLAVKYLPYE